MTTTPTGSDAGPGEGRGTPPPDHGDRGPRVTRDEVRDLGRLRRTTGASPEGRHIAGVAGGLARHLDVDPVVVRVAMVVLVFLGGAGLVLYAAGWLFVPEEGEERGIVRLDARSRVMVGYLALGVAVLAVIGDTFGDFETGWALFPLVLMALIWAAASDGWGSRRREDRSATGAGEGPVDLSKPSYATSTGDTGGSATWPAGGTTPPEPREPRRRGPLLFWFTLCLTALALGTLGIVEAAGADVPDSAYPALALGIIGALLVLGSFWGRAGGLILLGLIAAVGLVGAVGAEEFPGDRIVVAPGSAAALSDDYGFDVGEMVVDLTGITDPGSLDGRTLELDGDVGRIEVVVPAGLGLDGEIAVDGPGHVQAFGTESGGFSTVLDLAEPGDSVLTLDADLSVGEITVRSE